MNTKLLARDATVFPYDSSFDLLIFGWHRLCCDQRPKGLIIVDEHGNNRVLQ
jgi:hypothetical protein